MRCCQSEAVSTESLIGILFFRQIPAVLRVLFSPIMPISSRSVLCAVVALCLSIVLWLVPALAQTTDLSAVLDHAADYVARYEDEQLGNVIASEDYVQNAVWYFNPGIVANRQQRRTQSDFLIVLIGSERIGVRQVNQVDRAKVKSKTPGLDAITDESPESMLRLIKTLREESTQYNIGSVFRQINLPTNALRVARRLEASRFEFKKHGTDKIDGVEVWEVRFQELRAPTLVKGTGGESLLSHGSLWIEPLTGRILKTEFSIENPFSKPPVKGKVTVTYKPNKALGILVPSEMNEHFEAELSAVDCVAKYSNFRSFKVDVSSGTLQPKP
jgi:hypothetical protein